MNKAIIEDINKNYLQAIELYEQNLQSKIVNIEDYINLSFIYWATAALEFEFNVPNQIPSKISIIGGKRFLHIVDEGILCFPESAELKFWKMYYNYRLFSDKFSERDCLEILEKNKKKSLVPYFFLQMFNKEIYKKETQLLKGLCEDEQTAKNLYILSFL
ncbi:hypothetical protein PN465_01485 [Nodularia spumigena CS-584]|nr:hypothetical protein [Nodularia spumigena CS-584]